jgi:hypothetical protein
MALDCCPSVSALRQLFGAERREPVAQTPTILQNAWFRSRSEPPLYVSFPARCRRLIQYPLGIGFGALCNCSDNGHKMVIKWANKWLLVSSAQPCSALWLEVCQLGSQSYAF